MKIKTIISSLMAATLLVTGVPGLGQTVTTVYAEEGEKNTLVYACEGSSAINPLSDGSEMSDIVFSGLLKYDGNNKPVEDLAESYSYDEETMTYTFKLRDNVKWHDGEDFTIDDVIFTYKLLTEDESLSSAVTSDYEDIESVEKVDDKTLQIKMKQYNVAMPNYFTVGIVPKHLLEGKDITTDSFNQNPVGTGRYKFVSWDTAGGTISFESNEDYYGKVPNIKNLVFKPVDNRTNKTAMLQTGEVDLAWLDANLAKTFEGNEDFTITEFTTADFRGLCMNYNLDFWKENADSVGVLNYAVDKEAIVKSVLDEEGVAAYSPIQLSEMGGNTEADIYSYDLDKFAEEMEKLGWVKGDDGIYERNGQKFEFTVHITDSEEERVDMGKLVADQLKNAGVKMEIAIDSTWDSTQFDSFVYGEACQFDADQCYKMFTTGGSQNTQAYSNEKIDELLTKARHEKDQEARKEVFGEFEVEYAKQPSILLLAYLDGFYVGTSQLKGLNTSRVLGHHARGVMWNVEEWTLE